MRREFPGGGFFTPDGRLSDVSGLADRLNVFYRDHKIISKKMRLVVKTPDCVMRFAKVPPVKRRDLDGLIKNNIAGYFPNFGDFSYSYKIAGEQADGITVMLAALPEDFTAPYIEAFSRRGLTIEKLGVFQDAAVAATDDFGGAAVFALFFPDRVSVTYIENGSPKAAGVLLRDGADSLRAEYNMFARIHGIHGDAPLYFAEPDRTDADACFPLAERRAVSVSGVLESYAG